MAKKSYIITADHTEIVGVAETIRERRFLSDTENVATYSWYPLGDSGMQAIEITLIKGADVSEEDLKLLTTHYTSMDIGVLNPDNSVASQVSGGEVLSFD